MNKGQANTKNETAKRLDELEQRVDLLQEETNGLKGRLSWVSLASNDCPDEQKPETITPVTSYILSQINRIIDKTNETIGITRGTQNRLDI